MKNSHALDKIINYQKVIILRKVCSVEKKKIQSFPFLQKLKEQLQRTRQPQETKEVELEGAIGISLGKLCRHGRIMYWEHK